MGGGIGGLGPTVERAAAGAGPHPRLRPQRVVIMGERGPLAGASRRKVLPVVAMPNRLADASSPYLLQHQDNPVDWYPWSPEAFARARAEDKPVFLSIGYAACHWCHVMAHESFESEDIAALMNQLFVNVKVDREERPDVDQVYVTAIQVLGQGGGWPLSAFCLPDGRPFYLGTYFPPEDRYGQPGFRRVLELMARLYRDERDQVEHNAAAIVEGLSAFDAHHRGSGAGELGRLRDDALVEAGRWLAQRSDPHHGGFGTRPKFPSCASHDVLARAGRLPAGAAAREAFLRQARAMAEGGIYDHLGGGFARYAVDQRWQVPHFEKMLYDNGQLLRIYGDAFALTGEPRFREVIAETVGWLERELLAPSGGLYASQDADSEGEEGRFYVWTPAQLTAALGERDGAQLARHYGVTAEGNFERATSVLSRVTARGAVAEEAELQALRRRLLAARAQRVAPATDTKVLAGWNALAVTGLARAWAATGDASALALALRVAGFLADAMVHGDGRRIWRVHKDGVSSLDGTLDDYAFAAEAFLALAEATEDPRWWRAGRRLLDAVVERFYAEHDGVGIFYLTPHDAAGELIHRPESYRDGALPSGAGVAVGALVRVARVCGDERARTIAERYLSRRLEEVNPMSAGTLLAAMDLYLNGAELVVTAGEGRAALLAAARRAYAPTLMIAGPWAQASITAGKLPTGAGHARAYVCQGVSCSPPVDAPDALARLLSSP